MFSLECRLQYMVRIVSHYWSISAIWTPSTISAKYLYNIYTMLYKCFVFAGMALQPAERQSDPGDIVSASTHVVANCYMEAG